MPMPTAELKNAYNERREEIEAETDTNGLATLTKEYEQARFRYGIARAALIGAMRRPNNRAARAVISAAFDALAR